jgi:flagellar hook-associated protein 3 FlgL
MTSRVTQRMMSTSSLTALQTSLSRLSRTQERMSTGRVLNRPSDSPTDTTTAMRLRSSIADQKQYARNAEDGLGWLDLADTTLRSIGDLVRRGRDLALQGANATTADAASRSALAAEVDQLRDAALAGANTTYLDRPLFGGVTAGATAYDTTTGAFTGTAGVVQRTVGRTVVVPVNVNGPDAFGPDGASVFDALAGLSTALVAGDQAGITAAMDALRTAGDRITSTVADVGARQNRLDGATQSAKDAVLGLTSSLSEVENADIAATAVDLQMQQVAYQASLAVTARVMQPSLLDFLR